MGWIGVVDCVLVDARPDIFEVGLSWGLVKGFEGCLYWYAEFGWFDSL
jgi:hypothetical protein